jgi:hypothetical protein
METLCYNQQQQNQRNKFVCNLCDYSTSRKCNFNDHLTSRKHYLATIVNTKSAKSAIKPFNDNNAIFSCSTCSKIYNDRTGLWRHKKKGCITKDNQENHDYKELILSVIKDNQEMKEIMLEVVKNSNTTNHISNCNNNNNNKSFNLNFFLNETCKDAMNIMDFVNSVNLQLDDLEEVGEVGFVNGISNIIIKNLKTLDVTQRPLHCSDAKREVLYVKDEDKWEKEQDNKPKVRKAIKHIACKNAKLLTTFQEVYPQSKDSESKYNDKFNQLVIEAFGGLGNEDINVSVKKNEDKIIHNLTKEVIIDKDKE